MKKLLVITFALACFAVSKANPIIPPTPDIQLSELAFSSTGKWTIELSILSSNYYAQIDSIVLSSSTGKSRIKNIIKQGNNRLMMVTNDSLLSNLTINPNGDSIQVMYYTQYTYPIGTPHLSTPVAYGNYRNSKLLSPAIGQSIALLGVHSIDKSPTLGLANDSTGMCGTIKGKIYDTNNQLLMNSNLKFTGSGLYDISPNADGSYSTRILSFKNHLTQFFYDTQISGLPGIQHFTVDITPIDVSIKPDTIVTVDIHMQKITAIKVVKSDPISVIQIFPNPIRDLSFNYQISIPVKSSNSYLELISINGQKMANYPISTDKGKIDLPANITNGVYNLRLFVNNKNYSTSKILIEK
jgi:hypothetical protein